MVLKEEFPTLAERLASHGYHTAGFGHIGGDGVERGFRTKVDLVDSPLRDAYLSEQRYVRSLGTAHPAGMYGAHPFADEDLLDDRTCRLACDWINRAEGPFFLQVDFMNPHIPLLAPKRHVDRYRVHDISLPPSAHDGLRDRPANVRGTREATYMQGRSDEELLESIRHYRALTSYVDELTGRILAALEHRGLRGDTVIVFGSDHGDYAGEFGMIGKTGNFYDCLTRVPLIFSGPAELLGTGRYSHPVGLIDIAPTVLEMTGIDGAGELHGRDLTPLFRDETPDPPAGSAPETGDPVVPDGRSANNRVLGRYAFSETAGRSAPSNEERSTSAYWDSTELSPLPTDPYSSGPVSHVYDGVMVTDGRYKLSVYGDGTQELYDLQRDPWERHNLTDEPALQADHHQAQVRLLTALTRRQMECRGTEEMQSPLPYHYRATAAELIPERVQDAHRAWRPQGD
jgi:arylsulfatase A-like enzyme